MNQTNPCKEYNVPKITEVNGHNNVVITYDIDSTSNTISLNMISSHGSFNANRSITENTDDYRPPGQSARSI